MRFQNRKYGKTKLSHYRFFIWLSLIIGIIAGIILTHLDYPSLATQGKKIETSIYQENQQPHPVDPDSFQSRIINAVERVSPAVVSISTERTVKLNYPEAFEEFYKRFYQQLPPLEFKQKGLGSGMVISQRGYILTNEHLLHEVDKDKITVTLSDGRSFKAKIVAINEKSDLALLKIKADNLSPVIFGDSNNLKIGQFVIALGNPFGFVLSQLNKKYEPTVTIGVVSAMGRAIQVEGTGQAKAYENLIQTDASINPGNSGGPLINIYGEVVGVNSSILSPSGGSIGIGFAIPINKVKQVIKELIR